VSLKSFEAKQMKLPKDLFLVEFLQWNTARRKAQLLLGQILYWPLNTHSEKIFRIFIFEKNSKYLVNDVHNCERSRHASVYEAFF